MEESRLELKVGALVLAAVFAIFGLLMLMGEVTFTTGDSLAVNFSHTGNVVKNAPVKLAGVPVGRVESVDLYPGRRDDHGASLPVKMTLSVTKQTLEALKEDVQVTISSVGPLGEAYLELWPGQKEAPHNPSTEVRGTDSPRIDVVSNRLAGFLEAASKVLESDPQALHKLVGGIGGLSTTVDGMLLENRADFKTLAAELAIAAKDLRALAATARTQLDPGGKAHALIDDASAAAKSVRADLPELSRQASVALGGLARATGPLTEEDGQKLKALIAHADTFGAKAESLASRADKLLARIEAGEGTAGKVAKDPAVYDELKSLLTDLKKNPWKLLWKD